MKVAFVSGHIDLSHEEFELHYQNKIDDALREGHGFVVGDAPGTDTMAIQYLKDKTVHVTIYHLGSNTREKVEFQTKGNFISHKEKDAAMTTHSDYDILYVRSVEEQRQRIGDKYNPKRLCGTEQNRRRRLNKT